jgi:hypothetical protein
MRRVHCDHDELGDDYGASLDIALSSPSRRYPDLRAFLDACGAGRGVAAPPGWSGWSFIVQEVRRFTGVDLPPIHDRAVREVVVIGDESDLREVAASAGSWFVWYRWQTDS